MIEGIFVEGLIYGIMVLGVFITFRILDFPDLTVDGTFPMGAVIAATCLSSGMHPVPSLLLAASGGIIGGFITAVIHTKLKVPGLLAGILTMTMLYSVNIRILGGRANLPLLRVKTVMTMIKDARPDFISMPVMNLIVFILIIGILKVLLDLFFHTDLGLTLGALGNNEQMIISQGINPDVLKYLGVGLANGLVALSGGLAAQYQGFADINMGQGIVVSGLASVMIGEFLLRSSKIGVLTLRVILGSVLYKAIMYFGRFYGYYIHLTPNDLKLLSGLLIILSLVITKKDSWFSFKKRKVAS